MIPVRQLLRVLGVRVRSSKRADCPLCKGNSTGTLAFTERLWCCHRCNEGGDVFSFVRAVNRCEFPDALRYVAGLAGIRQDDHRSADSRRKLAARKRQRDRVEDGAHKLVALEHALRIECRDRIHDAERQRRKVGERLAGLVRGEPQRFRGEQEGLWLTLQAAVSLLNTDLPAYTLLSFGAPDKRAQFVLHPELRDEIIAGVRWAGYVRTADGKQIEVMA
jgi:DNA primase